jgi:tetratricopeptide (TPR) repeat protein
MRVASPNERHVACVVDASRVAFVVAVHDLLERSSSTAVSLTVFCADELSRAVLVECALPRLRLVARHELRPILPGTEAESFKLARCVDWLSRRVGTNVTLEAIELDEHLTSSTAGIDGYRRAVLTLEARFPYLPKQEEPRLVVGPPPPRPGFMPLHISSLKPTTATPSVTVPTPEPSRSSVRDAIAKSGMDAPLFAALAGVNHALKATFGPSEVRAARAVMMSLVAEALEDRSVAESEPKTAATTRPEAPAAPKQWLAPAATTSPESDPEPITSERVQSLVRLIERAAAADNLDAAERYVMKLIDLRPADPDVRLTAGHLAMRRGLLRTADEHFVRASLFAADATPDIKSDVATAFVALARSWLASAEPDLARLDLQRALRLSPEHEEARAFESELKTLGAAKKPSELAARDALFAQGETAAAAGDWSKALELFSALTEQHADFAPAHVGRASACLALGRVEEGLAALSKACGFDRKNVALRVQLGALYLQASRLDDAYALFEGLTKSHPESVEARLGLAESHRLAGRPLDAIDVLDRAHRERADEPAFIAAIGTLAAELGDRDAAVTALTTLKSMAPGHPRTAALETSLRSAASLAL